MPLPPPFGGPPSPATGKVAKLSPYFLPSPPTVISNEVRNPPGRTRSFLGIPPLAPLGRDDRMAYARSG